jgi:uncharacterized protein with FMN-binding domain
MMQRALPLALTALAALPVVGTQTSTPAAAASLYSSGTRTFKGPVEDVNHGPIQVTILVRNKKIVGVKAATAPEGPRSVFIQGQAIPLLKQETVKAQSAKIDEVSGATDTSVGYIASLQAAIKAARHAKALK